MNLIFKLSLVQGFYMIRLYEGTDGMFVFPDIMAHGFAGNGTYFEWWWLACRCRELTYMYVYVCLFIRPENDSEHILLQLLLLKESSMCVSDQVLNHSVTFKLADYPSLHHLVLSLLFLLSSLCCFFCSYLHWINYNLRLLITQHFVLLIFRTVCSSGVWEIIHLFWLDGPRSLICEPWPQISQTDFNSNADDNPVMGCDVELCVMSVTFSEG